MAGKSSGGSIVVDFTLENTILKFTNCYLARDHSIVKDDLWVRHRKILNPFHVFFGEKRNPDVTIDCCGSLIAPGFIDLQINGGFGIDFTYEVDKVDEGVTKVATNVPQHGVTALCPTIVSSDSSVYSKILPKLRKRMGGKEGAAVLGIHLEGPFINPERKGAHDAKVLKTLDKGMGTVNETYGPMSNVCIVTIAPEIPNCLSVIEQLTQQRIIVSIGHTMCSLSEAERALDHGATMITHLFNAMSHFHHRDPGLVGLVSHEVKSVFYGIICDGVHTHPASIKMAYRTNPRGCVLVTDAVAAYGLRDGKYHIGRQSVDVKGGVAYIMNTETLSGSVVGMIDCVKIFKESTGCKLVDALEAASLHPAQVMRLERQKGTLNYGSDADFIMLNKGLQVLQTWIGGKCFYKNNELKETDFAFSSDEVPQLATPIAFKYTASNVHIKLPHVLH